MKSSAEIAILYKVAELAKRCGLKASDADGRLLFTDEDRDPEGSGFYSLELSGIPVDPLKREPHAKFRALLGMEGSTLKVTDLGNLEDVVDRALSLARAARTR